MLKKQQQLLSTEESSFSSDLCGYSGKTANFELFSLFNDDDCDDIQLEAIERDVLEKISSFFSQRIGK